MSPCNQRIPVVMLLRTRVQSLNQNGRRFELVVGHDDGMPSVDEREGRNNV